MKFVDDFGIEERVDVEELLDIDDERAEINRLDSHSCLSLSLKTHRSRLLTRVFFELMKIDRLRKISNHLSKQNYEN